MDKYSKAIVYYLRYLIERSGRPLLSRLMTYFFIEVLFYFGGCVTYKLITHLFL
jgi:hypothetical protein